MAKVRHVLGISGGKDSAALALYMSEKYPNLGTEYYTCDTGRELTETYQLIDKLNKHLGRPILQLSNTEDRSPEKSPFDHFLARYGGYLPSSQSRWCTKVLKLEPFETYIGDAPTVSYVGIRGDENRDGYISTKSNVQSIFPFRKNIWSEDVIRKFLANTNIPSLGGYFKDVLPQSKWGVAKKFVEEPLGLGFTQTQKLNALLEFDVKAFNQAVFEWLKTTEYPVGMLESFPLVDNDEIIVIDDVYEILRNSVGVPAYYNPESYFVEIDGEKKEGKYSRSRSGCFFCFFQQKIEWVWLLENHPKLFEESMTFEKDGYSWMDSETLAELAKPERVEQIKRDHYVKTHKKKGVLDTDWQDEVAEAEGDGCASCFI
jgi:3'-phosphoadenosine 5'-phosphosulfate sulfotransferase (PAPS reductase)/FAD synthetase